MATYRRLKAEHKKLEHDFTTMGRIAGLVATLNEEHEVCCWELVCTIHGCMRLYADSLMYSVACLYMLTVSCTVWLIC